MSVCVSCREHISKSRCANIVKFLCMYLKVWSSSGGVEICCVLTSGFVDDVVFANNRSGNDNVSKEYSQSDLPEAAA